MIQSREASLLPSSLKCLDFLSWVGRSTARFLTPFQKEFICPPSRRSPRTSLEKTRRALGSCFSCERAGGFDGVFFPFLLPIIIFLNGPTSSETSQISDCLAPLFVELRRSYAVGGFSSFKPVLPSPFSKELAPAKPPILFIFPG